MKQVHIPHNLIVKNDKNYGKESHLPSTIINEGVTEASIAGILARYTISY